jgi:hypothetical protein
VATDECIFRIILKQPVEIKKMIKHDNSKDPEGWSPTLEKGIDDARIQRPGIAELQSHKQCTMLCIIDQGIGNSEGRILIVHLHFKTGVPSS